MAVSGSCAKNNNTSQFFVVFSDYDIKFHGISSYERKWCEIFKARK